MDKNGLLALFQGEHGTGKTTAALSFPDPIYVFDFDKKGTSIEDTHYPNKKIDRGYFESIYDVDEKLMSLSSNCPYQTIIADSFTHLGKLIKNSMSKKKGEYGAKMLDKMLGPKGDRVMMDFYQLEPSYLSDFTSELKFLYRKEGNPKHVIVIAHLVMYDGAPNFQGGGATKFRQILAQGKKAGAILPTEFDDVYTFGIKQPEDIWDPKSKPQRLCYTQAFGEDMAKCSWDFPKIIDCTELRLYNQLAPLMDKTKSTEFNTIPDWVK